MSSTLLDGLNAAQKQAVLHGAGPAMVLAGAGSGKTRVLTTRAAWLIQEQHVDPHQILLVTFTNKAAQEIASRLLKQTGHKLPFAGTFHRICGKILRKDGYLIGLDPHFLIYDTDDQLDLIKMLYKQNGWSEKEFHPKAVKGTISEAKNEMLSATEYREKAVGRYQEFVGHAYVQYQHQLQEQQAVDFDDLMLKTVELFAAHPHILEAYQQQFVHVLIDEYQDTNKVQYALSKALAAPQNNLYVVGDFAQSIYAWRGADYRNMLNLKLDFPGIQEYKLEQNYRSSQTILDAATNVISQNTTHPILKLWTENTDQEPITLYEADSGEDEARQITHYIKTHDLEYGLCDRVVLYRTNAQSRSFEEAFIRAGIPYKLVGGVKFYARKEIKDVLAYLRLLVNPKDEVSRERAVKLGKRKYEVFRVWKEDYRQKMDHDPELAAPLQTLKEILEITEYQSKYSDHDPEDFARLENIQELLSVAAQFTSIDQFLENIALLQDNEMADVTVDGKADVVTMMSIHSAKGLEYPIVYVVGLEEGLFPHSRSILDKDQMEEERRLCYVAITRAKYHLYLSYARRRMVYGSITSSLPSRFLNDIPANLIKKEASPSYARLSSFGSQYGSGGAGSYGGSYGSGNFNGAYGRPVEKQSKWHLDDQPEEPDQFGLRALNKRLDNIGRKQKYVPLDDASLDDVLSGEMDIEAFLEK